MTVVLYQRGWPHGAGDLPERLSAAVADVGLGRGLQFSENLQPHGGEHLVVADRDRALVARLRPADELDAVAVSKNLRAVSTLAASGAPVLAPAWPAPLPLGGAEQWVVTLWPLAINKPVIFDEMAEVIRRIHDTCPPDGMRQWLELCYGRVRHEAQSLRALRPAPPEEVADECVSLADAMMSRLEALVAESPQVPPCRGRRVVARG